MTRPSSVPSRTDLDQCGEDEQAAHHVAGDAVRLPSESGAGSKKIGASRSFRLETVGRTMAREYDVPMNTKTRHDNVTAATFLAKARTYLTEGDLLQASEWGWGLPPKW